MISIIVAVDKKRGIGKKGRIPWHISDELKRFKQITMGHPIIMGRKTYESIGRVLPGRTNIVVTREPEKIEKQEGLMVAGLLEEALRLAALAQGNDEVFVIGGGQIYEQALRLVDRLYITEIDKDFHADVFFPDYYDFKKVISKEPKETDGLRYKLLVLER